jgi:hypothetical protein
MLTYLHTLTLQEKAIITACVVIGVSLLLYFTVAEPMLLARYLSPEEWANRHQ